MKIEVILEKEGDEFSASSSSFPGCIACGETREDALKNFKEAMELLLGKKIGKIVTKEKVILNLDEDLSDLKQLSEMSMKRLFAKKEEERELL